MIKVNSKIYVAGHKGLVGSAIVRELKKKGYKKIIVANREKLNLTNQLSVFKFLKKNKPDFIFLAAAKVGGIHSNNKYKADLDREIARLRDFEVSKIRMEEAQKYRDKLNKFTEDMEALHM